MNKLFLVSKGSSDLKYGKDWGCDEQPNLTRVDLIQTDSDLNVLSKMNIEVKPHGSESNGIPEGFAAMNILLLSEGAELIAATKDYDFRLVFVAMRRYMAEGVDKNFKSINRTHVECSPGVTAKSLMEEYIKQNGAK